MNALSALDRVRVVLIRPTHPGNVGAAARAMKVMGLRELWLVRPTAARLDPAAVARASGAVDVLERARVVETLPDALAGTVFAAALTARRRDLSLPRRAPREAAAELLAWSGRGDAALVFGSESAGLSNDELSLCARPVTIPTSADYASLNLGAAVQLMCYELRLAALGEGAALPAEPLPEPATHAEIEGFFTHLETSIVSSGFLDSARPRRLMLRLRRLFGRTRLEKEEVAILRGILASFSAGRNK
ncbi:MAG: RNA methyltransferase [Azoarcus sp.]|jgi:tRNA/rRNA methyltransferase|nr:RNA methyltransferase [Azoarcus sp.]